MDVVEGAVVGERQKGMLQVLQFETPLFLLLVCSKCRPKVGDGCDVRATGLVGSEQVGADVGVGETEIDGLPKERRGHPTETPHTRFDLRSKKGHPSSRSTDDTLRELFRVN